jgi:hypothetical protein
MKKSLIFPAVMAALVVMACSGSPRVILSHPPIHSETTLDAAKDFISQEKWEEAHELLLVALDADPQLARDRNFIRMLAYSAHKMGIEDFSKETFVFADSVKDGKGVKP